MLRSWRACQDRGSNCRRRSQLEAPQPLLDRVQLGHLCKRLHATRSGVIPVRVQHMCHVTGRNAGGQQQGRPAQLMAQLGEEGAADTAPTGTPDDNDAGLA